MTRHRDTHYTPFLHEAEIEKRREWQEQIYQNLKDARDEYKVQVLGKELYVCPNVFAPLWGDSIVLAETVLEETKEGDYVLDLGTGTGIQAIFAAEKAGNVLAVDVNPAAVKCSKKNVKYHAMDNKIEVIESDLFSSVDEKFDMIIYNPPFRWFKSRDMLERASLDENYESLNRFFSEAREHLRENGRIIIVFSTSGDIEYFEYLIKEYEFKSEVIGWRKQNMWEYKIYRLIKDPVEFIYDRES